MSSHLDIAVEEETNVLVGGHRNGDHGCLFAPTLLARVTPDMRVVREEIFGPVVWINTWAEQGNNALPFGGYKQSGIGREGGLEVFDVSQSKTVLIAL